ncbi:MAG: hypothetical protein AB8B37_00380 [Prochlorococcus sp.]
MNDTKIPRLSGSFHYRAGGRWRLWMVRSWKWGQASCPLEEIKALGKRMVSEGIAPDQSVAMLLF